MYFRKNQEENEYQESVNIGSFCLHILCGRLKAGEDASGRDLSKILKSVWKVFGDSLAQRDIYLRLCSSNLFGVIYMMYMMDGK